jgi:hypothetical protein
MIKQVKELRPKFQSGSFGYRSSLEHGKIEVVDSGGSQ